MLRGDFGIYSVFEQKLYRVAGDDDRGIGVFARASYSPPDRNLIDYYADSGLEFIWSERPKTKGQVRDCRRLRACVAMGPRA